MKGIFYVLVSTFMLLGNMQLSQADDQLTTLNETLSIYRQAVLDNDFDTALDLTYPSIFTLAPRAEMQAGLEQMAASGQAPQVKKVLTEVNPPIRDFSNGVFTTINTDIEMVLNSPDPDNAEVNDFLLTTLKTQMGADSNVSYNAEEASFNIQKQGLFVAINEADSGWKFFDYEQALSAPEASKLLPADILEALASTNE